MLLTQLAEAAPKAHKMVMESGDPDTLMKWVDIVQKKALPNEKEVSVDNVRERVQRTLQVIHQHCAPAQAETIMLALEPIWK